MSKELSLVEKLSDIQASLKAPKSQYNSFGNYKYRSLEDILEAVKPLLAKHKLVLTLSDEVVSNGEVETSENKSSNESEFKETENESSSEMKSSTFKESKNYIKVTARLTDGRDTIEVTGTARESNDKKGMDSSQLSGSTSSYARKYTLNGLFLIDDTKDADATNDHGKKSDEKPTKSSFSKPKKDEKPKADAAKKEEAKKEKPKFGSGKKTSSFRKKS